MQLPRTSTIKHLPPRVVEIVPENVPGQRSMFEDVITGTAPAETIASPSPLGEAKQAVDGFDFWHRRPILTHIHTFALARMVSPEAVLGCTLLRAVAQTSPRVQLPPTIGGRASLNLFMAAVAASGEGKGGALAAAEDAFTWPGEAPLRINLGSGEGIAHAYAKRVGTGDEAEVKMQRVTAQFELAEVDQFAAMTTRQGATIDSVIRSVYSGEPLGNANASKDRTIPLAAHSYRATLLLGVQPKQAGALLRAVGGGTPQRFMWMPARSSEVTLEPPAEPDAMHLRLTPWPVSDEACIMQIPDVAKDTIRRAHVARMQGEGEAIDGHALLTRTKIAAAFAILDGRLDVDDEDWLLSGWVMSVSDRTRAEIMVVLQDADERANESRGRSEGARQDAAATEIEKRAVSRVSAKLYDKIRAAGKDGINRAALRRGVTSRDRPYFDAAVDELGTLITQDAEGRFVSSAAQ